MTASQEDRHILDHPTTIEGWQAKYNRLVESKNSVVSECHCLKRERDEALKHLKIYRDALRQLLTNSQLSEHQFLIVNKALSIIDMEK